MKKNCQWFIICLYGLGLFFQSCQTESKIDLPEYNPKKVIICVLSPESKSILQCIVAETFAYFTPYKKDTGLRYDPGATVILRSGNDSIKFSFTGRGYEETTGTFKIEHGKSYELTVKFSDNSIKRVFTTVPPKIDKNKIDLQDYRANFFKDKGFRILAKNYLKQDYNFSGFYRFENAVYLSNSSFFGSSQFGTQGVLEDFSNVSPSKPIEYNMFLDYTDGFSMQPYDKLDSLKSSVVIFDKDLGKYVQQNTAFANFDAFAEPIFAYSNIPDGLGVFGCYTLAVKTFVP